MKSSNELIDLFSKFDRECNTIKCPACRSFCRDWVQTGIVVYRIINEDDVDDGDLELAESVIQVSVGVIKEYKDKKSEAGVVVNEQ
ncbi:MAG: hypothetical protein RXQ94_09230 [Caldivirga sp.]